ncbi:MAG: nucleotidyltransferase domain-containing protein [Bacteroidota bacterium]
MTIDELKERNLIIFECISGSRSYGTDLPTSDTDLKGVYVLPEADFYGLNYVEQVNNASNDEVYYELRRFIELLYRNNPNLLEMLAVPADCLLYRHPAMDLISTRTFLSKLCQGTFAGYAMAQIKKARGLNKKILNPMSEQLKDILDFCFVTHAQGAMPVKDWLVSQGVEQSFCGLVNVPHIKNFYALFYDKNQELGFRGIVKEQSEDVVLSSVPEGMAPITHLSFHKDGFSSYCKDYREYWEWVEKRNEERYENTLKHGKNYDAKNMMHTIRLLDMAEEIATQHNIIVRRPNREFLLRIRAGEFSYEELVAMAEEKVQRIELLFAQTDLPEQPDFTTINNLLVQMRQTVYEYWKT